MKINVYQSSGGKSLLDDVSREALPIVLTILEGIDKDGLENFSIKPIDKKSPKLLEIRKKDVRVFFYEENGCVNITSITNHKQKNKTENVDKQRAIERKNAMRNDPKHHLKGLN